MIPLYRRLLGPRFDTLPMAIRRLHDGDGRYVGRARVIRGENLLAKLMANLLTLPRPGEDVAVEVCFTSDGIRETWQRSFDGRCFTSTQWEENDQLHERLPFTRLVFAVHADGQGLSLELKRVCLLGISAGRLLRPRVIAKETARNGRFHFFIRTELPLLGLLVQYEGELEPA